MQLMGVTRLYVGSGAMTFPFDTCSVERIEILPRPVSGCPGVLGGTINVVFP
jgi:iron complex outermembrane receptor protein